MAGTVRNMEVFSVDGSYALRAPSYIDNRVLAANAEEVYTIPAGANYLVFSATGNFYAGYEAEAAGGLYPPATFTIAVPAADVSDGSGVELNPVVRYVGGVTPTGKKEIKKVHLIAPAGVVISIAAFV